MFGGWCFCRCGLIKLLHTVGNLVCSHGKRRQYKWQIYTIRWVKSIIKSINFKALCLYTERKEHCPSKQGENSTFKIMYKCYSLEAVCCTWVKNENLPWDNNLRFCYVCSDTFTCLLMWLSLPTVLCHVILFRELHRSALNLLVFKWVFLLLADCSCESWRVRSI